MSEQPCRHVGLGAVYIIGRELLDIPGLRVTVARVVAD